MPAKTEPERTAEDVLELNLRLIEQIDARREVYPDDEQLTLAATLAIAVDLILDTGERENDDAMRLEIALHLQGLSARFTKRWQNRHHS